jgi:hypothetical protein
MLASFMLCCVLHGACAAAEETVASTETPAAAPAVVENAIVKIFSTVRHPDPYRPWSKQPPAEVSGTGVVIDGKRILPKQY